MVANSPILTMLEDVGAVHRKKHFVYTSGLHGPDYVNIDPLLPNIPAVHNVCAQMIEPFWGRFDVLAAPATGGIVFATYSAAILHRRGQPIRSVWADRTETGFAFERAGFAEQIPDKRVLVLDDILTSGSSVKAVCRLVEDHGGTLVGVSVICNRGMKTAADLGAPELKSIFNFETVSYPEKGCPLCKAKKPIVTNIGHGAEFKQKKPRYPGKFTTA